MDETNSASISQFFSNYLIPAANRVKNIIITSHILADVDALGSTIGLKYLISEISICQNVQVVLPQLNKIAQKIYKDLVNSQDIHKEWPEHIDLLIIVDSNDILMTDIPIDEKTNETKVQINEIVVIDHHIEPKSFDKRISKALIFNNYSSTAELIADFYEANQKKPTELVSKLLLLGILTDTGNFRYANNQTLENTEKLLLKHNINIRDLIGLLQLPMARPERIARIRAAMRIQELYYINEYVIAISHVSAYEASSCKALLDLGADISFVVAYDKKKSEFRASGRATEPILQETKLHLGQVMSLVGEQFNGSGGGHNGAAGCYGTIHSEDFMKEIVPVLLSALRKLLDSPNHIKTINEDASDSS